MHACRAWLGGLPLVLLAASISASESIPNWPSPPSWSPARSAGITTLSETNPLPFIAITPCRIADTRGNGFTGAYGPPALTQGAPRNFTLTGRCGIPASAAAVSLNVTVTNTQGPGFILIYPQGAAQPTVSTVNYVASQTIANAAVVPLSAGGAVTIIAGVSGTDLVLDTNGYYSQTTGASSQLAPGEFFGVFGSRAGSVIVGANFANSNFASGIKGVALAGSGQTFGVAGETLSLTTGAAGVWGNTYGGETSGVLGTGEGGATGVLGLAKVVGVQGFVLDDSGFSLAQGNLGSNLQTLGGVVGNCNLATTDSAGVLGWDGTGRLGNLGRGGAGVRGESFGSFGVLGVSRYIGVVGSLYNDSGLVAEGFLGSAFGSAAGFSPPWGVFASGNFGATGAKHFVEPHPVDPSKVILYSSLEGREVGTYFRGTARTSNREFVIEVPEDFRIVTDEEGLTVQLTPVGSMATMFVESEDLNRIVVRASKDVAFHYLVQGVRRAFKDFAPVREGMEFAPRSADDKLPLFLTEEAKRRLISNGTYNPDGSVNIETAERVGWTRIWKERDEQARVAAEVARAQAATSIPHQ